MEVQGQRLRGGEYQRQYHLSVTDEIAEKLILQSTAFYESFVKLTAVLHRALSINESIR
jgi:hypothetical protein